MCHLSACNVSRTYPFIQQAFVGYCNGTGILLCPELNTEERILFQSVFLGPSRVEGKTILPSFLDLKKVRPAAFYRASLDS